MDSDGDGLEQLVDEMEGRFVVATGGGVAYRLDMDQRLIAVLPESEASEPDDVEPATTRLLTVVTCSVGAPMVLLIDRRVRGIWFTRRVTAPVTRIERVDARSPLVRKVGS